MQGIHAFIISSVMLDIESAMQTNLSAQGYSAILLRVALSSAFGQSLGLFLNQAGPRRYCLSILTNGTTFVFGYLVWGASITVMLHFLHHYTRRNIFNSIDASGNMIGKVMISALTPRVRGFFVFIPLIGGPTHRVLTVRSYAIIVLGMQHLTHLPIYVCALVAVLGWGGLMISRFVSRRMLQSIRHLFIRNS